MPIYEYRCTGCGQEVEVLLRNPQSSAVQCPQCGAELSHRLPSAPARLLASFDSPTCCGREERCERPPCSEGGHCCHR